MKISAIDTRQDLYLIENILPDSLLQDIAQEPVENYEWELQEGQESWKRRKLILPASSNLNLVDKYLNEIRHTIASKIGVVWHEYDCWSSFWLDFPGFTTDVHLDGFLPSAMQLYLGQNIIDIGTVFYYNNVVPLQIRYKFEYKPNTGYLMLNNDRQWHGMLKPVPKDTFRLSSYTYFGTFDTK